MNNAKNPRQAPPHPNLQVLVFNKGPVEPELFYDGKPYKYPVGKAVAVPAAVAYFHFAADFRPGRLVRKKDPEPDGTASWYTDRLSSYQPMSLVYSDRKDREQWKLDQAELKAWHDWFDKGLIFETTGTSDQLSEEEFMALRKQKKNT
jgi:hypothetical protein